MIIKSKGHRYTKKLFEKLVRYLDQVDKNVDHQNNWSFFQNLNAYRRKEIVEQFEKNFTFKRSRKSSIALHHIIISFHELDAEKVTTEMLRDISNKFMELWGDGMAYFRVHTDGRPHLHGIVSTNAFMSDISLRKSRAEFKAIKLQLEEYCRIKYPDLVHSFIDHSGNSKDFEKLKPLTEQELRMKERLGRKPTKKELLKDELQTYLKEANSMSEFYDLLEQNGFTLYKQRGIIRGVINQAGVKFRFTTIGLSKDMILEIRSEYEKRLANMEEDRNQDIPFGNRDIKF